MRVFFRRGSIGRWRIRSRADCRLVCVFKASCWVNTSRGRERGRGHHKPSLALPPPPLPSSPPPVLWLVMVKHGIAWAQHGGWGLAWYSVALRGVACSRHGTVGCGWLSCRASRAVGPARSLMKGGLCGGHSHERTSSSSSGAPPQWRPVCLHPQAPSAFISSPARQPLIVLIVCVSGPFHVSPRGQRGEPTSSQEQEHGLQN